MFEKKEVTVQHRMELLHANVDAHGDRFTPECLRRMAECRHDAVPVTEDFAHDQAEKIQAMATALVWDDGRKTLDAQVELLDTPCGSAVEIGEVELAFGGTVHESATIDGIREIRKARPTCFSLVPRGTKVK